MANREIIQYWTNPQEEDDNNPYLRAQKEMILEIRTKGTEAQ